MEAHLQVVQPIQTQAIHPDRRRRERRAQPFEIEVESPQSTALGEPPSPTAAAEESDRIETRGVNEEGVGGSVDVTA